jgi:hypothetical protein
MAHPCALLIVKMNSKTVKMTVEMTIDSKYANGAVALFRIGL